VILLRSLKPTELLQNIGCENKFVTFYANIGISIDIGVLMWNVFKMDSKLDKREPTLDLSSTLPLFSWLRKPLTIPLNLQDVTMKRTFWKFPMRRLHGLRIAMEPYCGLS
jgi:hypothetical protein